MFSAVKIAAAAAIVALFGGFLVSNITSLPQGEEVAPAAATAPPSALLEPAGVEITTSERMLSMPEEEQEAGRPYVVADDVFASYNWKANDPRLSGIATYTGTWHYYPGLRTGLTAAVWTLKTDDGAWRGEGRGVNWASGIGDIMTIILTGEGGYEGLTAYLKWDNDSAYESTIRGVIIADELPPFPERAE